MNGKQKRKKKRRLIVILIVLVVLFGGVYFTHRSIYAIPSRYPIAGEAYPDMKQDSFHKYVSMDIDYKHPETGQFNGYYLLSPGFYKSRNVTFLLTDGQMELVSPNCDFDFFEGVLKDCAYVLIGVRGQSPLLFPQAYKNGKVDYPAAINLYNSDQQIEDIERVRLDMVKKGLLPDSARINVFGASGAGVLAQQYISKYGIHVNRVILESTGAPDISRNSGLNYSPDFKDFNPAAAAILDSVLLTREADKKFICNVLYQKGRSEHSPRAAQVTVLNKLNNGGGLWKYKIVPSMNLSILNYIIKSPEEVAARQRWFELAGYDLLKYNSSTETNLLYELSSEAVSDFLDYYKSKRLPAKDFNINRSDFKGEVLILKGTEDVVFSDDISKRLQRSYPNARLLFFKDGHRMQNNKALYSKIRKAFLEKGWRSEDLMQALEGARP
ncbi:hypothetical protein GWR56_04365 [Mucilaginibacter sp. 14171R-50]|uniref:alpha/beta fold hydrolase n=1 Tax=Mucilaginibacter sp. 14171R-50 TaxID=2703789 RepID=UPI00138C84CD|nr:hypothetical protein [Mucilaginibacter sp. 14171R-50]QHS54816.1 hypothetical protein GWR56_04365 [Mucilaginibacter sp. 14171R-50]